MSSVFYHSDRDEAKTGVLILPVDLSVKTTRETEPQTVSPCTIDKEDEWLARNVKLLYQGRLTFHRLRLDMIEERKKYTENPEDVIRPGLFAVQREYQRILGHARKCRVCLMTYGGNVSSIYRRGIPQISTMIH